MIFAEHDEDFVQNVATKVIYIDKEIKELQNKKILGYSKAERVLETIEKN